MEETKILTDQELKSKKIRDIFYLIESSLTDEEREEFSKLSGNEQHKYISDIYRRLNPLTVDETKTEATDEPTQVRVTVGAEDKVQTVTVEDAPKEEKPTKEDSKKDPPADEKAPEKTNDVQQKTETPTEGPKQPMDVEIGTVAGKDSPTSFGVDDYLQCTIRGTPNLNGTCTKSVQSILELLFRYPTAVVQFKTVARAQQFVNFVAAIKSVKGCGVIDVDRRTKILKSLKLANKLPE